ncbi:MAG TPA: LPO_1073/Vpar_1526 family protein [Metabacillus sp.]|nr:LPO_1073/Vpar_1526 family protein [Metabacillus sp.]
MEKNKQNQRVGDNSNSLQVGGDMYVSQGIQYSQIKEIAMDVFKSNFYDLGEEAAKIAKRRAEEAVSDFIDKLKKDAPESIKNMSDPDVQYSLFEVQKSYARLGDKEMSELLSDVLVKRISSQDESFLKLVLNESLTIIPKLTAKQIDILALIFFVRYVNFSQEIPLEIYWNNINGVIQSTDIPENDVFYQHLQYSGCLSISIGSASFNDIMKHKFPKGENEISASINSRSEIITLKRKWDKTKLCNSTLTSVGIAIAISHLKRKTGIELDYRIWING